MSVAHNLATFEALIKILSYNRETFGDILIGDCMLCGEYNRTCGHSQTPEGIKNMNPHEASTLLYNFLQIFYDDLDFRKQTKILKRIHKD